MESNAAGPPPDPAGLHHVPVLADTVAAHLRIAPDAAVIDGTMGGGGHTAQLLAGAPGGRVLGLDADPAALRRVQQRFADEIAQGRLVPVQANFEELEPVARAHGFTQVDAILLDLGVSSFQLETPERGFSFQADGPLDMRFDAGQPVSAAVIVNEWPEREIADLIYRYGEERRSRAIARAIVKHRPIQTTAQLAQVVAQAVGGRKRGKTHPATQTFQALRIAVNRELDQLAAVLPQCLALLKPGGRLAVISFHSLEDRIVKQWMAGQAGKSQPPAVHPHFSYRASPPLGLQLTEPSSQQPPPQPSQTSTPQPTPPGLVPSTSEPLHQPPEPSSQQTSPQPSSPPSQPASSLSSQPPWTPSPQPPSPQSLQSSSPPPQPTLKLITPKPVTANPAEILANPRSRSAKLRVAERL